MLLCFEVKSLPANVGDTEDARDVGLIPGSERSPGEGNGNPLRYSCLGEPLDRGACRPRPIELHELDMLSTHTVSLVYLRLSELE